MAMFGGAAPADRSASCTSATTTASSAPPDADDAFRQIRDWLRGEPERGHHPRRRGPRLRRGRRAGARRSRAWPTSPTPGRRAPPMPTLRQMIETQAQRADHGRVPGRGRPLVPRCLQERARRRRRTSSPARPSSRATRTRRAPTRTRCFLVNHWIDNGLAGPRRRRRGERGRRPRSSGDGVSGSSATTCRTSWPSTSTPRAT